MEIHNIIYIFHFCVSSYFFLLINETHNKLTKINFVNIRNNTQFDTTKNQSIVIGPLNTNSDTIFLFL